MIEDAITKHLTSTAVYLWGTLAAHRSELRQKTVKEQGRMVIKRRRLGDVVHPQHVPHDLAPLVVRKVHQPGRKLRQHGVRCALHPVQQLIGWRGPAAS